MLAAAPVKVAVPGFTVAGIEQALADAYVDHFVTVLSHERGLQVTTQRDIVQALSLERQKQLLGCADDQSSCLAELAGALGAPVIASGSLARTGTGYLATLRLIASKDAQPVYESTGNFDDLAGLQRWLEAEAVRAAAQLREHFGVREPPGVAVRLAPGIAGLALGAGGAVLLGFSRSVADQLVNHPRSFGSDADAATAANNGKLMERWGYALAITAASRFWPRWCGCSSETPHEAASTGGLPRAAGLHRLEPARRRCLVRSSLL